MGGWTGPEAPVFLFQKDIHCFLFLERKADGEDRTGISYLSLEKASSGFQIAKNPA